MKWLATRNISALMALWVAVAVPICFACIVLIKWYVSGSFAATAPVKICFACILLIKWYGLIVALLLVRERRP